MLWGKLVTVWCPPGPRFRVKAIQGVCGTPGVGLARERGRRWGVRRGFLVSGLGPVLSSLGGEGGGKAREVLAQAAPRPAMPLLRRAMPLLRHAMHCVWSGYMPSTGAWHSMGRGKGAEHLSLKG
jgi:hypothetical protein